MMKEPQASEVTKADVEQQNVEEISDSSIVAANAIKYTAYIMLFFGFLYFLIQYLAPML
jgi:hypothetical protein